MNKAIPANNQRNDRTHIAQIGGTIKITKVTIDNTKVFNIDYMDAKVVELQKIDNLHVIKLADSGISSDTINSEIKVTKERYAQVAVNLNFGNIEEKSVANGSDIRSSIYNSATQKWEISPEAKALVDQYGSTNTADQHIYVFYCKFTRQWESDPEIHGGGKFRTCKGFSTPPTMTTWPEAYTNNIFIDCQVDTADPERINHPAHTVFTLAHEMCHILTKMGHWGTLVGSVWGKKDDTHHNLLDRTDEAATTADEMKYSSTKRIYQLEEDRIRYNFSKLH